MISEIDECISSSTILNNLRDLGYNTRKNNLIRCGLMYLLTHQEILEKCPQLLLYASSEKATLDAIRNSHSKTKESKKK
ncbi:MAG: hypothetical protein ACR2LL_02815 [Nitrosopumilus sp.]